MLATTKMSSRGQVVIPETIRKHLRLQAGDQFVVLGEKDTIILKTIKSPSIEEFDALTAKARKAAKAAGVKPSDIARIIAEVRKENEPCH